MVRGQYPSEWAAHRGGCVSTKADFPAEDACFDIHLAHMRLDVASRLPACIERDDTVVQPGLALAHDLTHAI